VEYQLTSHKEALLKGTNQLICRGRFSSASLVPNKQETHRSF